LISHQIKNKFIKMIINRLVTYHNSVLHHELELRKINIISAATLFVLCLGLYATLWMCARHTTPFTGRAVKAE